MSDCAGDPQGDAKGISPRGYCSRDGSKLKKARILGPQPRRRPRGKEGVDKKKKCPLALLFWK